MSETTTAVDTVKTKAAEKAVRAVAAASETLPTVVATSEHTLELPSKVVLNQKLIVVASFAAGAGLTAGALWGVKKFKIYRANKAVDAEIAETVDEITSEKH